VPPWDEEGLGAFHCFLLFITIFRLLLLLLQAPPWNKERLDTFSYFLFITIISVELLPLF